MFRITPGPHLTCNADYRDLALLHRNQLLEPEEYTACMDAYVYAAREVASRRHVHDAHIPHVGLRARVAPRVAIGCYVISWLIRQRVHAYAPELREADLSAVYALYKPYWCRALREAEQSTEGMRLPPLYLPTKVTKHVMYYLYVCPTILGGAIKTNRNFMSGSGQREHITHLARSQLRAHLEK